MEKEKLIKKYLKLLRLTQEGGEEEKRRARNLLQNLKIQLDVLHITENDIEFYKQSENEEITNKI